MITAAELVVKYRSDTSDLDRGAGQANRSLGSMAAGAESAGRKMSLGLTAPIALMGATALKSAAEAGQGQAQMAAMLKSTEGVSGHTAESLNGLAAELQKVSTFEDDAIVQGTNLLGTFTKIRNEAGAGNDVFDQTTKAMLNVSAAMGKDLQSSAIMVGKALNDPIKGATALGRAGVQLTESQKKQIESAVKQGRTMDAQKIILAELETQFGGVAEAQAKTPWGKSQQAANAMGNALESLGNVLAPIVAKLSGWLSSISGWLDGLSPGMKKFVVGLLAVVAAVGPLLIVGAKLVMAFNTIKTAMAGLNLAFMANPFVLLGLAIVALVVVVVKNWDTIKRVLLAGLKALVGFFTGAWDRIKSVTRAVWNGIKAFLSGVWNALAGAAKAVWNGILGYFRWVLNLYKTIFTKAWEAIKGAVGAAWSGIKDAVVNAARGILDFIRSIPGRILDALGDLGGLLFDAGKSIITGLLNGLKSAIGSVWDFVGGIPGKIADLKGPLPKDRVLLIPAGEAIVEGLARGMKRNENLVLAQSKRLGGLVEGALSPRLGASGGLSISGGSSAPGGLISTPSAAGAGGARDLATAFSRALEDHDRKRRARRTGDLREKITLEMDSRKVAEVERRRALLMGEIV